MGTVFCALSVLLRYLWMGLCPEAENVSKKEARRSFAHIQPASLRVFRGDGGDRLNGEAEDENVC